MIDRRELLKLGTASVTATQAATFAAQAAARRIELDRIVVFNADCAEGRSFAEDAALEGAQRIAITGELAPAIRQKLYTRLRSRPTVLVGLTTENNAFQCRMLGGDAFHFEASRTVIADRSDTGERLVEWIIVPVAELGA